MYVHAGIFLNNQRESIPLLSTVVMFSLLLNPFLELLSAEPMCRMQSSHDKFLTLVWCWHSSPNIRLAYTDPLLQDRLHWGIVSTHGCYHKQNNVPSAIPQNIHSQLQDQRQRFVNLTPATVILEEETSIERRTQQKNVETLWVIFLINDWRSSAQPTMNSAPLGRWSGLYKKASWTSQENAWMQASRQPSSMASTSVPVSRFLLWLSSVMGWLWHLSQLNPFLSKLLFTVVCHHSNRNQTHTATSHAELRRQDSGSCHWNFAMHIPNYADRSDLTKGYLGDEN